MSSVKSTVVIAACVPATGKPAVLLRERSSAVVVVDPVLVVLSFVTAAISRLAAAAMSSIFSACEGPGNEVNPSLSRPNVHETAKVYVKIKPRLKIKIVALPVLTFYAHAH